MSPRPRPRFFLSSEPKQLWPDAVVHHGVRILVGILLCVGIVALFPATPGVNVGRYQQGVVADQDVIAEIPFSVLKNTAALNAERDSAAAATIPTFRYRPQIADSVITGLDRFFVAVDSAVEVGGAAGVQDVLNRHAIDASAAQVQLLTEGVAARQLQVDATEAVERLFPGGVIDPGQASEITADSIRLIRGSRESVVPRDWVLSGREFFDRAIEERPANDEAELLRSILARFAEPNLALDVGRTDGDRQRSRAAVSAVVQNVLQGEAIVRANQQVGPEDLAKLEAYRTQLRSEGIEVDGSDLRGGAGGILLNFLILGIMGLLLLFFRAPLYQDFRVIILLAGIIVLYFVGGAVVHRQGIPPQALPIGFAAVAVAILWDGRLALLMAFVLTGLTAVQQPFGDVDLVVTLLVGGSAAALSARTFRRLSQAWVFIALTTAAFAAALLGLGLRSDEFVFVTPLLAAGVSTVVGVILAVGFLPVFEWLAGVTTETTLLGLADANRPLLRRLATEAPGTYAHTIQVANMAEAAANAIGADGLLCRVGMLYHDVGKMERPDHFIENQKGTNPHDQLPPAESARIIIDHVVAGERMVKAEKIPAVLVDFVREHHGDQVISYFYSKAVAEAEETGEAPPDRSDFQYPGPRPQSRETAIAMLADAIESASRAMKEPTGDRLRDLVDGIIEARIKDGQLEESTLTFKDLKAIKNQFLGTLASIYHQRIDYPETRHLTDQVPQNPSSDAGEPVEVPLQTTPEPRGDGDGS